MHSQHCPHLVPVKKTANPLSQPVCRYRNTEQKFSWKLVEKPLWTNISLSRSRNIFPSINFRALLKGTTRERVLAQKIGWEAMIWSNHIRNCSTYLQLSSANFVVRFWEGLYTGQEIKCSTPASYLQTTRNKAASIINISYHCSVGREVIIGDQI